MNIMGRDLKYVVFADDGVCVARCLDVEVTSDGVTKDDAIANLREALELYFEGREGGDQEYSKMIMQHTFSALIRCKRC